MLYIGYLIILYGKNIKKSVLEISIFELPRKTAQASCALAPLGAPRLESCGVLVTRASTRQHKKILISGSIGAFRSGKRVADMAVLSPGTVMKSSGQRPPTENTVSGDTVLFPLHRLHIEMHMACTADFNPVPVQRYLQPPSNSYIRIA